MKRKRGLYKVVICMFLILCISLSFILPLSEVRKARQDLYWEFKPEEQKENVNIEEKSREDMRVEETEETENAVRTKELTGELVIRGTGNMAQTRNIEAFMEKYPGVSIKLLASGTLNEYPEIAANSLLSGEEIDIIQTSGLTLPTYAEKGYFVDLLEYMERDDEFIYEDYFYDIFESMKYQGKIFNIAGGCNFGFCYINKKVTDGLGIELEEYDAITTYELIDMYMRAVENGVIEADYPFLYNRDKYVFWGQEQRRFIDIEERRVQFNTTEFEEYLEYTDRPAAFRTMKDVPQFEVQEDLEIPNQEMEYFAKAFFGIGDYNFEGALEETEFRSRAMPLKSSDGNYIFGTSTPYAIMSSSPNKDLAWEFVKFIIGEREKGGSWDYQWWLLDCNVPVNKNNLKNVFLNKFTEKEVIQIYDWMGRYNTVNFPIYEIEEIIYDSFSVYYDDKMITVEEMSEKLQEIAEMYLLEF